MTADPGYEAGERAAKFIGAKVIRVPLTKSYAHDVKAMAAASPDAGLIYVCNPNNPTGTLTPREEIEWLVANKPKGSVLLLDEAYIHIAGAPMCSDLVAQGQRHHHPADLLQDLRHGGPARRGGDGASRPAGKDSGLSAGALPVTGMVAATASLKSKTLVPERRKIIGDVRARRLRVPRQA